MRGIGGAGGAGQWGAGAASAAGGSWFLSRGGAGGGSRYMQAPSSPWSPQRAGLFSRITGSPLLRAMGMAGLITGGFTAASQSGSGFGNWLGGLHNDSFMEGFQPVEDFLPTDYSSLGIFNPNLNAEQRRLMLMSMLPMEVEPLMNPQGGFGYQIGIGPQGMDFGLAGGQALPGANINYDAIRKRMFWNMRQYRGGDGGTFDIFSGASSNDDIAFQNEKQDSILRELELWNSFAYSDLSESAQAEAVKAGMDAFNMKEKLGIGDDMFKALQSSYNTPMWEKITTFLGITAQNTSQLGSLFEILSSARSGGSSTGGTFSGFTIDDVPQSWRDKYPNATDDFIVSQWVQHGYSQGIPIHPLMLEPYNIGIGNTVEVVSPFLAAKGGIVTRATNIIAGEAGAEAIIPLEDGGIPFEVNIYISGQALEAGYETVIQRRERYGRFS